MNINLSKEGIFPITHDKHGNLISNTTNTGLEISGTIQGEGGLIGVPCLFIRLSGCNLRCCFDTNNFIELCDTPHTSWNAEYVKYEIDDIISIISHNIRNLKHIVISGGEPLIQMTALIELTKKIKEHFNLHITIETNGTIFNKELTQYVDLFSISPKLSSSNPTPYKLSMLDNYYNTKVNHNKIRYNLEALQSFIDNKHNYNIQFKFVVSTEQDIKEIKEEYISLLKNVNNSDIMLMPIGMTVEHLQQSKQLIIRECINNGWRYTTRLHIELFGNKLGV